MRPRRLLLLVTGLAFLGTTSAFAEPAPRVLEGRAVFGKDAREWGLSVAQGTGLGIWGSQGGDAEDVRFVGLVPRYGVGLSDPVAEESLLHGNLELLVEAGLLAAYGPKGGFLGGANVVLRYNFLSFERLVPFVELGAGVAYLELDLESQSDGIAFTPQGGLGLHWWLSPQTSLTAAWRLHHVSNAGIGADNDGINESLLLIGVSWFP
jgi:hypothetical protein